MEDVLIAVCFVFQGRVKCSEHNHSFPMSGPTATSASEAARARVQWPDGYSGQTAHSARCERSCSARRTAGSYGPFR